MSITWLKGRPLRGIEAGQEAQNIAKALEASEVLVNEVKI
jgi:hypothetical protein